MEDWMLSVVEFAALEVPRLSEDHIEHRSDWSDIFAIKGAREILKGVKYPDEATRRSLYASWLRIFAESEWDDSFDGLMLDCVAATPSPTTPAQPLFASIYKVSDPVIDGPYPNAQSPVLSPDKIPHLFASKSEPIEPLPSSPGIVNYLADLIRKSCANRQALDEAGLIIGFCSLALAVVAAKPVGEVQDFFQTRMRKVLTAAVPTSYDGDLFCPSKAFLTALASKTLSASGVVKPFLVLLVLGQYAYHVSIKKAGSRADIRFLEDGYLRQAKYGQLEIIELLYRVQEVTELRADAINEAIKVDACTESMEDSCSDVREYLEEAERPNQKTRPWCRTVNKSFFWALRLRVNLDYATRLTALLAPDPKEKLWQRPEFRKLPAVRVAEALSWALRFKQDIWWKILRGCHKCTGL